MEVNNTVRNSIFFCILGIALGVAFTLWGLDGFRTKQENPLQSTKDSLQAVISSQDSIISALETELATAPQTIETVKIKYHVKRDDIRALPPDSGIKFMSEWLSAKDSN